MGKRRKTAPGSAAFQPCSTSGHAVFTAADTAIISKGGEKKSCESWTVSDAFWEDIDENGRPPAVVLSGANTHDVKLLEDTLDHIVVLRPRLDTQYLQQRILPSSDQQSTRKNLLQTITAQAN